MVDSLFDLSFNFDWMVGSLFDLSFSFDSMFDLSVNVLLDADRFLSVDARRQHLLRWCGG
jgi:hypothetical protein